MTCRVLIALSLVAVTSCRRMQTSSSTDWSQVTCSTTGSNGVGAGHTCVFPFKYLGLTYNSCTDEGQWEDGDYWCSTKVDSDGSHIMGQWGSCSASCPNPYSCFSKSPMNGGNGDCPTVIQSGQSCNPSCDSGFERVGISSCSYGRLEKAKCEPKSCSRTAPSNGGNGDCPPTILHGQSCSPVCNEGFQLVGSTSCTYGALTIAKCKPLTCTSSNPQNGGVGDCPQTLWHGQTCTPTCESGYTRMGVTTCNLGEITVATCQPKPCVTSVPENADNGDCPESLSHGQSCSPNCNAGYTQVGRTTCAAGVLTKASCQPIRFRNHEDFSFMTSDFSRAEHSRGFFGTFTEWFGGRAVNDVKTEIVQGHTCTKKTTNRDETYYATSYCYWMPEIQGSRKGPGLTWVGGAHPRGKELCGGMAAEGKCVKCSVCHNNARDGDGGVDKTPFLEDLTPLLPQGCLKEKEIERTCLGEYDEKAKYLIAEINRCDEVENRYDSAVHAFEECEKNLHELPIEINTRIPEEMRRAQQRIEHLNGQLENANRRMWDERRDMYHTCQDYVRGWRDGKVIRRPQPIDWFHSLDDRGVPTSHILRMASSIRCQRPNEPRKPTRPQEPRRPADRQNWQEPPKPAICNSPPPVNPTTGQAEKPAECVQYELALRRIAEGKQQEARVWNLYKQQKEQYPGLLQQYTDNMERYTEAMHRYHAEMGFFSACRRCDYASDELAQADNHVNKLERELTSANKVPGQLQQRLDRAKADYADWQRKYPGLKETKDLMDAEWLPQKPDCRQAKSDYETGKKNYINYCAPPKYPQSCEKACIELQSHKNIGCAVVEGQRPMDNMAVGGLEVKCAPPQPSWILTPHTYGAEIDTADQCQRILSHQRPYYAQKILKKGWLHKKGRGLNGWDKRFFLIESGDKARSAVLRYFELDPFRSFSTWTESEREDKGIILWDAKSTKAKTGSHYNWNDGSECFKLYHFYRDYRLCVPGDFVDPEDPSKSVADHRDEWMEILDDAIKHQEWQ